MKRSLIIFIVAMLVFGLTITAVLSFTLVTDQDTNAEVLHKRPGRTTYGVNTAVIDADAVALRKRPGRS